MRTGLMNERGWTSELIDFYNCVHKLRILGCEYITLGSRKSGRRRVHRSAVAFKECSSRWWVFLFCFYDSKLALKSWTDQKTKNLKPCCFYNCVHKLRILGCEYITLACRKKNRGRRDQKPRNLVVFYLIVVLLLIAGRRILWRPPQRWSLEMVWKMLLELLLMLLLFLKLPGLWK
jgi:hypothetical protein